MFRLYDVKYDGNLQLTSTLYVCVCVCVCVCMSLNLNLITWRDILGPDKLSSIYSICGIMLNIYI